LLNVLANWSNFLWPKKELIADDIKTVSLIPYGLKRNKNLNSYKMLAISAALFNVWMFNHGKYYSGNEYNYRLSVFTDNVNRIHEHNVGGHSWNMSINKYADVTPGEFSARFTGSLLKSDVKKRSVFRGFKNTNIPESIDWVSVGAVTPVKNQGQCGSCWSFSTTGSVEGAWFLAKKELVSLSEQQLVDCSTVQGNEGCNGGLMDYAFQYIIANGGITTEAAYPYSATGPNDCQAAGKPVAATIHSYHDIPVSEDALLAAIAQQPVSVAIEADQSSFQFYSGGVMSAACGTALDHGVLAVGYGTDSSSGLDYYKVKNSWGADWGTNGYILLARGTSYNPNGQCGIQMSASMPSV
jgi:C1A family cysteine protease